MRSYIFAGLAVALTASTAFAQAEHYQPIRVDSGLTGTYTASAGRGGFGAVVEPKYLIHDNVAIGLHFEGAVMFGGSIGENGDTSMSMGVVAATLAKGEYLLGLGSVRPFVGLGIGMFDIASQSVSTSSMNASVDQKAGRFFGIAPQIGIDLGRVRLAATYNYMLGADIVVEQTVNGAMQTASYSQNYLSFDLSFRFGGGMKRPAPPPVAAPAPEPVPAPTPAPAPAPEPAPAPAP